MESNSLILGRINANGALTKTYIESKFVDVDAEELRGLITKEKVYMTKDNQIISDVSELNSNLKEVVIIGVCPYNRYAFSGSTYSRFFVEIIEKGILLRHLKDERMILEDLRNNNNNNNPMSL